MDQQFGGDGRTESGQQFIGCDIVQRRWCARIITGHCVPPRTTVVHYLPVCREPRSRASADILKNPATRRWQGFRYRSGKSIHLVNTDLMASL
jgi:hypothetical protein